MNVSTDHPDQQRNFGFLLASAGILALVALVYWPVHEAWFVWDDRVLLHDNSWLSVGDGWIKIVLHGIADWRYFRPLGLALFVAELRCFGITPGPMHLLSLTMHLANTAMVGAIAWRLCASRIPAARAKRLTCISMLIFGLHPVLVEPISWIASQFDLLVTLFILLGLLLNVTVQRPYARASLVTVCFFLAACSKECGVAFPILLVLMDWMQSDDPTGSPSPRERLHALMSRQRLVYAGVLVAGIVYLIFRNWARTENGSPLDFEPWVPWTRFQNICFTYMTYWRMIVWPFVGLSPAHIIPATRFTAINLDSVTTDIAALGVGTAGLLLAWRRHPLGIAIVGVTATLLLVLHLIPVAFDDSLYHERYAAPGIAWVCALLPRMLATVMLPENYRPVVFKATMAVTACWLALATLTVRTTVPLWFNDDRMWEWSMRTNPDSLFVMASLMDGYIQENNLAGAEKIAHLMAPRARTCAVCLLDIANLALKEGDTKRAAEALKGADQAFSYFRNAASHNAVISYVILNGDMHMLDHDGAGAEAAFRDAISIDPMRPGPYMSLAFLLATEGRSDEAHREFDKGASISPGDAVKADLVTFNSALAEGARRKPQH